MPGDLGQVTSLLCFSLLLFSVLPLVCLVQLKKSEAELLFALSAYLANKVLTSLGYNSNNNHDKNLQVMPCISSTLAKKCFNNLLKHMCKFSYTMGSCS